LSALVGAGCLVAAPMLQGLSTFFWNDGSQGIDTGTLIVLATVCWIVGLTAVFRGIEDRAPRYTAIAYPLAMYGCVGGATFGVQGMLEELFRSDHTEAVRLIGEHPSAAYLAFWFAGSLFPLSVFALGAVLTRVRAVPAAVGVLICAGALALSAESHPARTTRGAPGRSAAARSVRLPGGQIGPESAGSRAPGHGRRSTTLITCGRPGCARGCSTSWFADRPRS